MDCSPPGSSVHGIYQARILEWVAISSSKASSPPRAYLYKWCPRGCWSSNRPSPSPGFISLQGNRKRKLGRRKYNKSHDYFFPLPPPCHLPLLAPQTFLISESARKSLASRFYPDHLLWGTMQVPELVHQLKERSSGFHVPWSDSEDGPL